LIASVAIAFLVTAAPDVPVDRHEFVERLVAAHVDQQQSDRAWDLMSAASMLGLGADLVAASFAPSRCCFLPSTGQMLEWGIPGILFAVFGALEIVAEIFALRHPDLGASWRDSPLPKIRSEAHDRRRTRQVNGWLTAAVGALEVTAMAVVLGSPGSVWFSSGYLWVGLSCAALLTLFGLHDALTSLLLPSAVERLIDAEPR
jgi:hypothetical protein